MKTRLLLLVSVSILLNIGALSFLNENIFTKPEWLVNQPYIFNITDDPDSRLYPIANSVISALVNTTKLDRMAVFARSDASNYKPEDYLSDLSAYVFAEISSGKAVDSYRRYIQRGYVTTALSVINDKSSNMSEGRFLLLAELQKIQTKAKKNSSSDAVTKAHWQEISKLISDGLK